MMPVTETRPLVSCIMPTYNRRAWIRRSIDCFLSQDYSERELVIVDDGSDAVGDLVPADPRIRYHRLDRKLSIGAKRNLACELAAGSLIAHWDDDDWYPSWRLSRQVAALASSPSDLCGTNQLYFFDDAGQRAFLYTCHDRRPWVAGSSFVYKKSLWQQTRFPDLQVGEDSKFLWTMSPNRVLDLKEARLCVASIHAQNTSPKIPSGPWWQPVPLAEIRRLINASLPTQENNFNQGCTMQTIEDHSKVHCGYRIARETDLKLTEFVAFNHGQDLPRMRRWELPWALFAAQLGNTLAVLDCTINPTNFAERIARLYPSVHYRHMNPAQDGAFRLPLGVPDEGFDRVFCINTLEHLVREQREALVADLARKLKPAGLLLLTSDYYFDSSWTDPAFLNAGFMRSDRSEFFGGWNKTTVQDWSALCQRQGLVPLDPAAWENPLEGDLGCFRNPAPFSHATMAGVFSIGPAASGRGKRVLLALLTWNTRDISIESVQAYLREARMLSRLGCDPRLCVCDNGSTDGTQAALRQMEPRVEIPYKFILNPKNSGNSVARNQIIDYMLECGADYVLFMDGDIEIVPFSSFAMLRYMENCGHRLGCIGADSSSHTSARNQASQCLYAIDSKRIEDVNYLAWTQYGMFRRAVFEQDVRFDESGPFQGPGWGLEDNDLAFQMEMRGFRNQRFMGMVYLHRSMQSSVRILRQLGLDPNALYKRRRQHVIEKWASVPHINDGPLALVRRFQTQL